MAVNLRIKSDFNDKGIKKAKGGISGLESHTKKSMQRIGKFIAAAFAFRQITGFTRSILEAFGIQQKAVEKLRAVLASNGEAADALVVQYQKLASELQLISDHGDEAILSIMALGRSMGLSGKNLEEATSAAVGLSQAFGITLESAMRNIAKLQGNLAGELGELIPELKEAETAQEKLNIVFAIGRQRLEESAKLNDTYARKVTLLSNKWGDVKEKLGEALVTFVESTGILDKVISLLDKINAMDFANFAASIKRNILAPLRVVYRYAEIVRGKLTGKPPGEAENPFLNDERKPPKPQAVRQTMRGPHAPLNLKELEMRYRGVKGLYESGWFVPEDSAPMSADEYNRLLKQIRADVGMEKSFAERVSDRSFRAGRFVGRQGRFGGPIEGGLSMEAVSRRRLMAQAKDVSVSALSGADLFDALRGESRAAKELGERGNPMHVVVENNPTIGVD